MPTAAAQKPFRKNKDKDIGRQTRHEWRKPKFTNKGGSNTDKALMGTYANRSKATNMEKKSKTPTQNATEVPTLKPSGLKQANDSSCRPVVRFPERHSNSKPAATSRQQKKCGTMLRYRHPCLLCTKQKKSPAIQAMPPSRHQRETIRFEKIIISSAKCSDGLLYAPQATALTILSAFAVKACFGWFCLPEKAIRITDFAV